MNLSGAMPIFCGSVLHSNQNLLTAACRVDCILPLGPSQSLADMAAAVISGGPAGFSGSACYLLSSIFNHS